MEQEFGTRTGTFQMLNRWPADIHAYPPRNFKHFKFRGTNVLLDVRAAYGTEISVTTVQFASN